MKRIVWPALLGMGSAATFLFFAFLAFPGSLLTELFLAPATLAAPVVGPIVAPLIKAVIPEGGPAGGVLLIITTAFLCWSLVGGGVALMALRGRKPRPEGAV